MASLSFNSYVPSVHNTAIMLSSGVGILKGFSFHRLDILSMKTCMVKLLLEFMSLRYNRCG